jgi:DNA-binding NtrC family response regulator
MRSVVATLEKVVDFDVNLLLLGESGSGKDYVAEAIHRCGNRSAQPFVRIECAGIPPDLFESELFGFEKGTFTDATSRKQGKLELAQGGTVYLDEIGNLAAPLQAKLLRVIEEKRFQRLGGPRAIQLDARFISSSNAPLDSRGESGGLRGDLYYRLNVVSLRIPSLRERLEDIPALATHFLANSAARHARSISGFDPEVLHLFAAYHWPGNVRELMTTVERAVIVAAGARISAADLPPEKFSAKESVLAFAAASEWSLDELERRYIQTVLERVNTNYSKAAAVLGISRKTLLEKRRKYRLDEP